MTTFDKHDDLPYDTHCHLLSLEVWIGNMEGRTIAIPTDGDTFIDDGTVDAEDAVKAVNALIAAIRFMADQRERLKSAVLEGEREKDVYRARWLSAFTPPEVKRLMTRVLRDHWLAGIHCDHEAKTDKPSCSCSMWNCPPQPTIGEAAERWIEHVLTKVGDLAALNPS